MPSHLFADPSAAQPPEREAVDALIEQARLLLGGVDGLRRETAADEDDDPRRHWRRALCDLAAHHLEDLGRQLGQLRDGPPSAGPAAAGPVPAASPGAGRGSPPARVGSAEWDLLTDEVDWSEELFRIFGRDPAGGPLSLDELPSWVVPEDQPLLTAMVTDCLVDGRPIDGEFRIVRPDHGMRTVHMTGEPVLDAEGRTASMWAVLRDVSELRRSQRAVRDSGDSLQRQRRAAQAEHRLAVELQEAVLPPWRGAQRFQRRGPAALDLAAHYLPSAGSALVGGDWYDALHLPDGRTWLSVGDLTGHGVTAASGMAMLLGAVRGMAVAGVGPARLMGHLNQLLDSGAHPALGSALCLCYDPRSRTLTWSQAGHPAPLLFRGGAGRPLEPPEGVLLGATLGAVYGQAEERLAPGDLLVLHTDGLAPRGGPSPDGAPESLPRLLGLAPRLTAARSARECVRIVAEEFEGTEREDGACVLIARVGP